MYPPPEVPTRTNGPVSPEATIQPSRSATRSLSWRGPGAGRCCQGSPCRRRRFASRRRGPAQRTRRTPWCRGHPPPGSPSAGRYRSSGRITLDRPARNRATRLEIRRGRRTGRGPEFDSADVCWSPLVALQPATADAAIRTTAPAAFTLSWSQAIVRRLARGSSCLGGSGGCRDRQPQEDAEREFRCGGDCGPRAISKTPHPSPVHAASMRLASRPARAAAVDVAFGTRPQSGSRSLPESRTMRARSGSLSRADCGRHQTNRASISGPLLIPVLGMPSSFFRPLPQVGAGADRIRAWMPGGFGQSSHKWTELEPPLLVAVAGRGPRAGLQRRRVSHLKASTPWICGESPSGPQPSTPSVGEPCPPMSVLRGAAPN